jgi:BMFP domain-containing protein YqiC
MKQLRIKEPWADLVHDNSEDAISDILIRVSILEKRIEKLEAQLAQPVHAEPAEAVGV